MLIYLYQNLSERIKVNKNLKLLATITGNMRGSMSVLSPSINLNIEDLIGIILDDDGNELVDDDGLTLIANDDFILKANYIYVQELERYYYIDAVTMVTNKIMNIDCSVDVLMTYMDEIGELNAYVARNENEYNKYIIDDQIVAQGDVDVDYTEIKGGFIPESVELTEECYVLTLVGRS